MSQAVNSWQVSQLPVSFASFLVSRPCWMGDSFPLCQNCHEHIEPSGDGWQHETGLVSCRPQATKAEPLSGMLALQSGLSFSAFLTLKTLHSADCQRSFGKYDLTCPRCRELAAGARPRKGWSRAY